MQPRIAIPADTLTKATNIINERNAAFAPRPLIEAVLKSGGVPVFFPSVAPELAASYLDLFDGIIFAGGADVEPIFFNEEPHLKLGPTYLKRDRFEVALLKEAVTANKAIMGICRGMQLINIALGGSVYQDLSEDPRQTLKHSQDAPSNLPSHHINVAPESRLFKLTGRRAYVNSHHQALHQIAPGLHVTARCQKPWNPSARTKSSPSNGIPRTCSNMIRHHKTCLPTCSSEPRPGVKNKTGYKERKSLHRPENQTVKAFLYRTNHFAG